MDNVLSAFRQFSLPIETFSSRELSRSVSLLFLFPFFCVLSTRLHTQTLCALPFSTAVLPLRVVGSSEISVFFESVFFSPAEISFPCASGRGRLCTSYLCVAQPSDFDEKEKNLRIHSARSLANSDFGLSPPPTIDSTSRALSLPLSLLRHLSLEFTGMFSRFANTFRTTSKSRLYTSMAAGTVPIVLVSNLSSSSSEGTQGGQSNGGKPAHHKPGGGFVNPWESFYVSYLFSTSKLGSSFGREGT